MLISVTGKGGTGKTTLTALLLDEYFRAGYRGKVLVIDGDPAATLTLALGLEHNGKTLAEIRDSDITSPANIKNLPEGVSVARAILDAIRQAGVVTQHTLNGSDVPFSLMVMGQPEGRGCYCSVNTVLSRVLNMILDSYDLVIVDNEAGLEHLNRLRLPKADLLMVVHTPAYPSISVAERIVTTTKQMEMEIGQTVMVCNRVPAHSKGQFAEQGADRWTIEVPLEPALVEIEADRLPVIALDAESNVRGALKGLMGIVA